MNPIIIVQPNQPVNPVRPINSNQPFVPIQAIQPNQPVVPYIIIWVNPSANIQGQNACQTCPRLLR